MKYILILWILLILGMFSNVHSQDMNHLVKQEQLSKDGYIVFKDTVTNQLYVEALMRPTNEGFIMPDGLPVIIFPKDLGKDDYNFILAFISFKLAEKKTFH